MTYRNLSPKLRQDYADLDLISKDYPLEWDVGVIRFKKNWAVAWLTRQVSLNDLARAHDTGNWPLEDMMMVYRMMGYSLCGFMDIFSERLAALQSPEPPQETTAGAQGGEEKS